MIVSGVVALTLSPMMGSQLLRAGDTERGFAGWINRRFEGVRKGYTRALAGTPRRPAGRPRPLGDRRAADRAVLHVLAEGARAGRGPGRRLRRSSRRRPTRRSTRRSSSPQQVVRRLPVVPRDGSIFQITCPTGGFGGMVTKPWSERTKTTQQLLVEAAGPLSKISGRPRHPADAAAAARRRRLPGGPRDRLDRGAGAARRDREQLVEKAFASGLFIFADADLKFDQPQAEVVFDRDKLRSQGVDLSQAGRDLSTLLGGNYVNRFSIQGRSYKVIPQVKRARAADAGPARARSTSPGRAASSCRCRPSRPCDDHRAARAEEVPAAERGPHPGRASRRRCRSTRRSAFLENEAAKILPQGFTHRLRRRVAPAAHRGRQVPRHVPALGDPDLPRARGAVRELPRSVHHPGGLGAAGDLRRAALLVPRRSRRSTSTARSA